MIMIQVLSPVSLAIASITHTININESQQTITGIQKIMGNDVDYGHTPLPDIEIKSSSLPTSTESDNRTTESILAHGLSRTGQILSSEDAPQASLNYARELAESLINNEINDWLNQRGSGRVVVGSDKTLSGDVLLPLHEHEEDIIFTQLGLRTREDRNTVNIGMGYRYFTGAWMYGVNTFYDYDYSGRNARVGVGTELWTDYLKFAANGYFRLTDWHQSRIHAMRDYDERPANGFDIRAEGWLPSWPQLGGTIKYEQYFGEGIDLSNSSASPDRLKRNPKAVTAGLNYTPFPLLTLSGEHSVGDRNQTRIGANLNYRFGVPLNQQMNPETVDIMRSLVGNRYDHVNRNYDIVMQYRKQTLLHISLPDAVNAQAAATVTVPVTVNKAKYGLKDTEWTPTAEFLAHGGTLRKLSPTQVEVRMPAYVYLRNGAAQDVSRSGAGD